MTLSISMLRIMILRKMSGSNMGVAMCSRASYSAHSSAAAAATKADEAEVGSGHDSYLAPSSPLPSNLSSTRRDTTIQIDNIPPIPQTNRSTSAGSVGIGGLAGLAGLAGLGGRGKEPGPPGYTKKDIFSAPSLRRPNTMPFHITPPRESETPVSTSNILDSSTAAQTPQPQLITPSQPPLQPSNTTTTSRQPQSTSAIKTEPNTDGMIKVKRPKRQRKAVLTITPTALSHLRTLQCQPPPNLIKISVIAKGCAGGAYKLEYVSSPSRLDEVVEQEGVKVVVDGMSLLKILGSTMDWRDDVLASRFVFRNPNVTSTCGCEESMAFGT